MLAQASGLETIVADCLQEAPPPNVCRDDVTCEVTRRAYCETKKRRRRKSYITVPAVRCMYSSECISTLCSARFNGQLFNKGLHLRASLTTSWNSKRKEGLLGSGERAPILLVLPIGGVGEMFSSVMGYIRSVSRWRGRKGLHQNHGDIDQQCFVPCV